MVVQGPHVGLVERGRERARRHPFDEATQVGRQSAEGGGVADGGEDVAFGAEFDTFSGGAALDGHDGLLVGG